jgi:hypothetical protein
MKHSSYGTVPPDTSGRVVSASDPAERTILSIFEYVGIFIGAFVGAPGKQPPEHCKPCQLS